MPSTRRWPGCDRRAAAGELERRPRAVAIGTFDGVHRGHQRVIRAARRRGARPDGRDVRPAPARGVRQPRRDDPHAGAAAGADRRRSASRTCSSSSSRRSSPAVGPRRSPSACSRAIGARGRRRGRRDSGSGTGGAGDLALLRAARLRRARGAARRGRVVVARSARCSRAGEMAGAAAMLGRPPEVDGRRRGRRRARRHARVPDREPGRRAAACSSRRTASTPGAARRPRAAVSIGDEPALRRRRAAHRGVPPRLRGRPVREAPASSSSGSACATSRRSGASRRWSTQIARDVESAADAAARPAPASASDGALELVHRLRCSPVRGLECGGYAKPPSAGRSA